MLLSIIVLSKKIKGLNNVEEKGSPYCKNRKEPRVAAIDNECFFPGSLLDHGLRNGGRIENL
jgi:hypothetical protein